MNQGAVVHGVAWCGWGCWGLLKVVEGDRDVSMLLLQASIHRFECPIGRLWAAATASWIFSAMLEPSFFGYTSATAQLVSASDNSPQNGVWGQWVAPAVLRVQLFNEHQPPSYHGSFGWSVSNVEVCPPSLAPLLLHRGRSKVVRAVWKRLLRLSPCSAEGLYWLETARHTCQSELFFLKIFP